MRLPELISSAVPHRRIIKPNWIQHLDDKDRPLSIFTLAVHPDRSRLATGGLDTKIRIWSTQPILDESAQDRDTVPKLLCTLGSHSGVVMHLRWSFEGRHLASGSDDNIVMVWTLDPGRGGKVWGTHETNIENWKAVKRLVGHDSDVAGIAWSPDDAYLASVGLDGAVLIWKTGSFELIRRLNGHEGFVKGVVFDPAGKYLATQSDDNSVKIWSTETWQIAGDIRAPFIGSPKTNLSRLSWSPEGCHLVTPNSMNGPVFVAAVIERDTWTSKNSMVGHENIVENSAFSPLLFLRDPNLPPTLTNVCTLVAISARSGISLWMTDRSEPLVVLESVFERDVLDLSWSSDGKELWSCSSEGHVCVFVFDLAELNPVAPPETRNNIFREKYGVIPRAPIRRAPLLSSSQPSSQQNIQGTIAQPNVLAPRKGPGAKRIVARPVVTQSQTQVMTTNAFQPPVQSMPAPPMFSGNGTNAIASTSNNIFAPPPNAYGAPPPNAFGPSHAYAPPPNAFASTSNSGGGQWGGVDPSGSGSGGMPVAGPSKRRRTTVTERDDDGDSRMGYAHYQQESPYHQHQRISTNPNRAVGHTLGGSREREPERELVELRPMYMPKERELTFAITNQDKEASKVKGGLKVLAVPAVLSYCELKVEDSSMKDTLEWRNFSSGGRKERAEVLVRTASDKTLWIDYLPSYIVCGAGSPQFTAVSTEDGSLIVYSPTGRRLLPTMVLDSPTSFLVAEGPYLLAITALGSLSVWNTCSLPPKAIFPPLSISSLLTSSATSSEPHPTITTSGLLPNGVPIIALTSGTTHSYDPNLCSWIRLSEPWWAKASEYWEGRRGKANATGRGPVRTIESAINDIVVDSATVVDNVLDLTGALTDENSAKTQPVGAEKEPAGEKEDFVPAVSLAHLETRMKAAIALDSANEYRTFLQVYTKRLAEEGIKNKAEELIKELLGPIYFKNVVEGWSPTLLGISKRDLLKEVLGILSKSRITNSLATEYQSLVRKIDACS